MKLTVLGKCNRFRREYAFKLIHRNIKPSVKFWKEASCFYREKCQWQKIQRGKIRVQGETLIEALGAVCDPTPEEKQPGGLNLL